MKSNHHFDTIATAIGYIADNFSAQPSLDQVAQQVHLSRFHFQRLFQQWAGVSPKQFLQHITVEHAKEKLLAGQSTLDAAYGVGLTGNG